MYGNRIFWKVIGSFLAKKREPITFKNILGPFWGIEYSGRL
jgi:hypothetical protein